MKSRLLPFLQGLMALVLITVAHSAFADDEHVGTSVSDAPSYVAKLTIKNNSASSVPYQLRWGNSAWKSFRLERGQTWAHSIAINDQGKYPAPHISFSAVTDFKGNVSATKAYKLIGYKVGYNGYGANPGSLTAPKRYEFTGSITRSSTIVDLKSVN